MKDEIIQKLDEADFFLFSVENYEDRINKLKAQAKALEDDCSRKRNKEAGIFEIFLTISTLLFIGAAVIFAIAIVASIPYWDNPNNMSWLFCGMYFPGGAIVALLGVLFVIFKLKIKGIDNKYDTHKKRIVNPQIEKLKEKMSEEYKELNEYIREDREKLDFLPDKYRNRYAITYFLDVLKSGEADSLKEAYSLYNAYLYRVRMEDAAVERRNAIVGAIQSLEREQEETNRNLKAIEQIEYWKYLNEKK